MKIIALCGKAGSGKDFIATNYILPYLELRNKNILQLAFADQMKINIMSKYDVHYNDLYEKKTQNTRKLLQLEGTELGRNKLGNDIWIKYYKNWLKIFKKRNNTDIILTPDLRFQNEMNYLKSKNSIIIKIVSPDRHHNRLLTESNGNTEIYNQFKNHISECDLDNLLDDNFDLILYNDPNNNMEIEIKKLYNLLDKLIP